MANCMKSWSRKCPANFLNKQALLEAELAALHGKIGTALSLFNKSIKAATKEGFVHEEGLAYERLAQYHCFLGNSLTATPFFERARDAYKRWGANTLVDRMEELIGTNCSSRSPV